MVSLIETYRMAERRRFMGRVPVSSEAGPLCFQEEEDDETSHRHESYSHITLQATTSSPYPRPLSLLYHLEGCVFTKQKSSSSKLLHYQNLNKKALYTTFSRGRVDQVPLFRACSKHQRNFFEGP